MGIHSKTRGADHSGNEFKADQPEAGKRGKYCTVKMVAGGDQNRTDVEQDQQDCGQLHSRNDKKDTK